MMRLPNGPAGILRGWRKNTVLASALLAALAICPAARAQPEYENEVFGGISYVRSAFGEDFDHGNLTGWNIAITRNLNPWLGLTADFSGTYGNVGVHPIIPEITRADMSQHTFLFGPQFRPYVAGRFETMVRVMFGASRGSADAGRLFRDSPFLLRASDTNFASTIGGAVDWRITDRWSWRIVQPEIFMSGYGKARVSTGVVYRFGIP